VTRDAYDTCVCVLIQCSYAYIMKIHIRKISIMFVIKVFHPDDGPHRAETCRRLLYYTVIFFMNYYKCI